MVKEQVDISATGKSEAPRFSATSDSASMQVTDISWRGYRWGNMFAVLLWALWKLRCHRLFQDFEPPSADISSDARTTFWVPPRLGEYKYNVDDGSVLSGALSAGGVLRDASGEWIHGFMQLMPVMSILEGEIRTASTTGLCASSLSPSSSSLPVAAQTEPYSCCAVDPSCSESSSPSYGSGCKSWSAKHSCFSSATLSVM